MATIHVPTTVHQWISILNSSLQELLDRSGELAASRGLDSISEDLRKKLLSSANQNADAGKVFDEFAVVC